jgi:hypothetical protein
MSKTSEPFDLDRTSKPASDRDVEAAAADIVAILKEFDSPKDAGAAFGLAHYDFLIAIYPPDRKAEALENVDACTKLLKDMLNDGWQ